MGDFEQANIKIPLLLLCITKEIPEILSFFHAGCPEASPGGGERGDSPFGSLSLWIQKARRTISRIRNLAAHGSGSLAEDPGWLYFEMEALLPALDKVSQAARQVGAMAPSLCPGERADGYGGEWERSCAELERKMDTLRGFLAQHTQTGMDQKGEERLMASIPVEAGAEVKKITVIKGNLCLTGEEYDLVVCSAFKNRYLPSAGTLIGDLFYLKNILVGQLAEDCELDLKAMGGWISKALPGAFHRIACVELLEYDPDVSSFTADIVTVKSAFSTLKYLMEQAALRGIPLKRIALPVLGSGSQNIELNYIASPLVTCCAEALRTVAGLEEIVFYEREEEKAAAISRQIQELACPCPAPADVFISYSSKQHEQARQIYDRLMAKKINCWMAPQSIPAGRAYYDEIDKAIKGSQAAVLLLTPDAVQSPWVKKEIASFMGSRKKVIPLQMGHFQMDGGWQYLLIDVQIIPQGESFLFDVDRLVAEVKRTLAQPVS